MAELISSNIDEERGKKVDTYRNDNGTTYTIEVDWGTPKPKAAVPAAYQLPDSSNYVPQSRTGQSPAVRAILNYGTQTTGVNPITGQVGQGITGAINPSTNQPYTSLAAAIAPAVQSQGQNLTEALAEQRKAYEAQLQQLRDSLTKQAQDETKRRKKDSALQGLLSSESKRREAGNEARTAFWQYGVASPGAIRKLEEQTKPLTREQVASQTGYGASDSDLDSIWEAVQKWQNSQGK